MMWCLSYIYTFFYFCIFFLYWNKIYSRMDKGSIYFVFFQRNYLAFFIVFQLNWEFFFLFFLLFISNIWQWNVELACEWVSTDSVQWIVFCLNSLNRFQWIFLFSQQILFYFYFFFQSTLIFFCYSILRCLRKSISFSK